MPNAPNNLGALTNPRPRRAPIGPPASAPIPAPNPPWNNSLPSPLKNPPFFFVHSEILSAIGPSVQCQALPIPFFIHSGIKSPIRVANDLMLPAKDLIPSPKSRAILMNPCFTGFKKLAIGFVIELANASLKPPTIPPLRLPFLSGLPNMASLNMSVVLSIPRELPSKTLPNTPNGPPNISGTIYPAAAPTLAPIHFSAAFFFFSSVSNPRNPNSFSLTCSLLWTRPVIPPIAIPAIGPNPVIAPRMYPRVPPFNVPGTFFLNHSCTFLEMTPLSLRSPLLKVSPNSQSWKFFEVEAKVNPAPMKLPSIGCPSSLPTPAPSIPPPMMTSLALRASAAILILPRARWARRMVPLAKLGKRMVP